MQHTALLTDWAQLERDSARDARRRETDLLASAVRTRVRSARRSRRRRQQQAHRAAAVAEPAYCQTAHRQHPRQARLRFARPGGGSVPVAASCQPDRGGGITIAAVAWPVPARSPGSNEQGAALATPGLSGNEDAATIARAYGERLTAVQESLVSAQTDADRQQCQTKLSELVEAYEFVTGSGRYTKDAANDDPGDVRCARTGAPSWRAVRRPTTRSCAWSRAQCSRAGSRSAHCSGQGGMGNVYAARDRLKERGRRDQGAAPGSAVQHRGEGPLSRRGKGLLRSVASEHRARARRRRERRLLLPLDGAAEGPHAASAHRGVLSASIAISLSRKSPISRASSSMRCATRIATSCIATSSPRTSGSRKTARSS